MINFGFSSNTVAASANQLYFESQADILHIGRVFYKIAQGGKHRYSLLFCNIIDSTYSDGSKSFMNRIMESWQIHSARVAKYPAESFKEGIRPIPAEEEFQELTFNGNHFKTVCEGEIFASDEFDFSAESGEYLCFELTFSGERLPYHEEGLLPVYRKTENGWIYDKRMPLPAIIGCNRSIKSKIGFLGDSITQGIGTAPNSYAHWNALLSEMLGSEYSCWNLGIGYARADDAASAGIWLKKALMNDIVFVCLGVNDLLQGFGESEIKDNLSKIVGLLKQHGKRVVLQTLPPFDYYGSQITAWENINEYILTELCGRVDCVFDCVTVLGEKNARHKAKYGGHPNEQGCALWAEALYKTITEAGFSKW